MVRMSAPRIYRPSRSLLPPKQELIRNAQTSPHHRITTSRPFFRDLAGDEYLRDEDGFLYSCGRSDDMLKIRDYGSRLLKFSATSALKRFANSSQTRQQVREVPNPITFRSLITRRPA